MRAATASSEGGLAGAGDGGGELGCGDGGVTGGVKGSGDGGGAGGGAYGGANGDGFANKPSADNGPGLSMDASKRTRVATQLSKIMMAVFGRHHRALLSCASEGGEAWWC